MGHSIMAGQAVPTIVILANRFASESLCNQQVHAHRAVATKVAVVKVGVAFALRARVRWGGGAPGPTLLEEYFGF